MPIVESFGWRFLALGLEEGGVLDKVESAKAGAPRIQGFEDDLGVVALVEVDRDGVQKAVEAGLERLDALDCRSAVVSDPLFDAITEIAPGGGDTPHRHLRGRSR